MKMILALVLSLASIASGQTTRPTTQVKEWKGIPAIIAAIPATMKPARSGPWERIHFERVGEWFKTIRGDRLTITGTLEKIGGATSERVNQTRLVVDVPAFSTNGVAFSGTSDCLLIPGDVDRATAKRVGVNVTVVGTITEISVTAAGAGDSASAIKVHVTLSDTSLK